MSGLGSIGHLLFRTRNAVFPLLLVVLVVCFPPRPLGAGADGLWMAAGLVVLAAGQGLRIATIGLDYIRRGGRDGRIHADRLVTGGLFACCRNPMYTGNVAMVIGFVLITANPITVIVGTLAGVAIYRAIIAAEEGFLRQAFGSAYEDYCRSVPRWLPSPVRLQRMSARHRFDWAAVVIREYGTLLTTVLIVLALLATKAARAGRLAGLAPILAGVLVAALLAWGVARYLKKSRRLRALASR